MTERRLRTVPPPDPGARRDRLCVRALSLWYAQRQVLGDVDLDLPEGRVTVLVGPSGTGKSSLLSAMNRLTDLLPGAHVAGSIQLDGDELLAPGVDTQALRRRVGMIFQAPNPFPMSIRRNLHFPLKEHGVRKRAERDAAMEAALRDVGLWDEVKDRLNTSALRLSGGQQQRLCLARAMVLKPDVLLFDEPCSALDPMAAAVVEESIARLRGKVTSLVVTHNLAQARRLADRLAVMWLRDGVGTVIEQGAPDALWERPEDADTAAYLTGRRG